jgi:hypothetical protein
MRDVLTGWTVEQRLVGRRDHVVVRARRGDGAPVVVKATLPGASWADRARLRHEGRLLDLARGPGVVDLLDVVDSRGRTALVLGFVPVSSARRPDLDLHPLAATVERLHRLGIVHGAIRREHVLLTAEAQPALCGFGQARRSTATGLDLADLARLV